MLPLHSQSTAAIYLSIGQGLPSILSEGGVFTKQAAPAFAEFL